MTASAATHRRHLARLTRHWLTRRQLARCGRLADRNIPVTQTATLTDALIEAIVEHAFTGEPPHAELPEDEPIDMRPIACAVCSGADFYASRTRPGCYRCRDCGETTEV